MPMYLHKKCDQFTFSTRRVWKSGKKIFCCVCHESFDPIAAKVTSLNNYSKHRTTKVLMLV